VKRRLIAAGLLLTVAALSTASGHLLVLDNPRPSDAVLVLAGESDYRLERALQLMHDGYGQHLFLDVEALRDYGMTRREQAERYLSTKLPQTSFTICESNSDSTWEEAQADHACLAAFPQFHSFLLVTNDYHSRRAQMTFAHAMPEHSWRVASVYDQARLRSPWWITRRSAKTWLNASVRLFWFIAVDRWRS
jgi:uncharacterized SAM-binding protein YcdF (DUF218 family)